MTGPEPAPGPRWVAEGPMTGAGAFMAFFALLFLRPAFVNQRKVWCRFRARRFANPSAHEPRTV